LDYEKPQKVIKFFSGGGAAAGEVESLVRWKGGSFKREGFKKIIMEQADSRKKGSGSNHRKTLVGLLRKGSPALLSKERKSTWRKSRTFLHRAEGTLSCLMLASNRSPKDEVEGTQWL